MEPQKAGSSTQNEVNSGATKNESANGDGGEPGGANAIEPRCVTFDQFKETCQEKFNDSEEVKTAIVKRLNTLQEKHAGSPIWNHKVLTQILSHYDYTIRLEEDSNARQMLFHDFVEEFKRVDKMLVTLRSKTSAERARLLKKIRNLQALIKKDLRKIDKYDQGTLGLSDLDDEESVHMKKEKYERRVARNAAKLLELQGLSRSFGRLLDQSFKYTGTGIAEIDEAITAKYRAMMQKKYKGRMPNRPMYSTPNVADIIDIIKDVSEKKKLKLSEEEIEAKARKVTKDVTDEVKRRRELELEEMMNDYEHDTHLRPDSLPDFGDEELNSKLTLNEKDYVIKMKNVVEDFKKNIEERSAADTDIGGGDEATSDDDEDEEADEDAMDEDEEFSDDGTGEVDEEGAEGVDIDDDDDDPVILDENSFQNGEEKGAKEEQEQASTSENKRPREDGDLAENESSSKKTKIDESQKASLSDLPSDSNPPTDQNNLGKEEATQDQVSEPFASSDPAQKEEKPNGTSLFGQGGDALDKDGVKSTNSIPNNSNHGVIEIKPKTSSNYESASEDSSIKIVDLESDKDKMIDDNDDDDVICLD